MMICYTDGAPCVLRMQVRLRSECQSAVRDLTQQVTGRITKLLHANTPGALQINRGPD